MVRSLTVIVIFSLVAMMSIKGTSSKQGPQITIAFAGDVMLGRLVNEVAKRQSPSYFWGDLKPELLKADLRVINLETAVTKSTKKIDQFKVFYFRADPVAIKILRKAKIDYVSLANNHVLDFGIEGLEDTIRHLDEAGILHAGAGLNHGQAKKPAMFQVKGTKIAILSFTDNESGWKASETQPGTNYLPIGDAGWRELEPQIKEAKKMADFVIVSGHWGPNMVQRPTRAFQDFAHRIIDAGADIFHGHSAHLFQGIEKYKDKLILYDTGDFVDDYYVDPSLRNDETFLVKVKIIAKEIKEVKLIPALISEFQVNKANGEDKERILTKMTGLCKELGTDLARKNDTLILDY